MKNKREKFVEIAEKRVNRLIKEIKLVGNLSNKNNYLYDLNDVNKIFSAIETEIKSAKAKFSSERPKGTDGFRL